MPLPMATAVFFAVSVDAHQRKMALAAVGEALAEYPDLVSAFGKIVKELSALAEQRNAALHTIWTVGLYEREPGIYHIRAEPEPTAPKHHALKEDFFAQFERLCRRLEQIYAMICEWDLGADEARGLTFRVPPVSPEP